MEKYPIQPPPEEYQTITLFDIMVLLDNVWRGSKDPVIGFEDAERTLFDLTMALNREVTVRMSDLESALWSCNIMNESNKFWHPKNHAFDYFVEKLLKGKQFNRVYNYVEEKKTDAT